MDSASDALLRRVKDRNRCPRIRSSLEFELDDDDDDDDDIISSLSLSLSWSLNVPCLSLCLVWYRCILRLKTRSKWVPMT